MKFNTRNNRAELVQKLFRRMTIFVFLALFLAPDAKIHAQFFSNAAIVSSSVDSNELSTQDEKPLLDYSTTGLYVSVGSERGFIGACLSKATALLLVDYDIDVVLYNNINIALLKLSNNQEDYLNLRLRYTREQILERAKASQRDDLQILSYDKAWKVWEKYVFHPNSHGLKYLQLPPPPDLTGDFAFKEGNYLYNKDHFLKIQKMAKKDLIKAYQIDLEKRDQVNKFVKIVGQFKLPISVFDLSNAWMSGYIKRFNLKYLFEALRNFTTSSSLALMTSWLDDSKVPKRIDSRTKLEFEKEPWGYFAFPFGFIKENWDKFIRRLDMFQSNGFELKYRTLSLNPTSDKDACDISLSSLQNKAIEKKGINQ